MRNKFKKGSDIVTKQEERMILLLKQRNIERDAAIYFMLFARETKSHDILEKWLEENKSLTTEQVTEKIEELS